MKSSRKKLKRKLQSAFNSLLILLLGASVVAGGYAVYLNLEHISELSEGEGTTLETSVRNTAGSYTIGNNPTQIGHAYFEELASALDVQDEQALAQAVVKNFVTEYFTWTNKDANYDVGGMQYIFTDVQRSFEEYTRDTFYSELHRYINTYGRENLMQVKDVSVSDCSDAEYTLTWEEEVLNEETQEAETVEFVLELKGYTITADWSYEENCSYDTSEFMNHAVFKVMNHDGRMEIVSMRSEEADEEDYDDED